MGFHWGEFKSYRVFGKKIVKFIMACVSSSSMQVIWIGELISQFYPSKRIRQGDSISTKVSLHHWNPNEGSNNGTMKSHLVFANDLLLFSKASRTQAQVFSQLLDQFCWAFSQMVSKEKLIIFFSRYITPQGGRVISGMSGFSLYMVIWGSI